MRLAPALAVLLLGISPVLAADRRTPVPDPKLGAIAVSLRIKGPTALTVSCDATEAYFVKVADGIDVGKASSLLASNFADTGQIYLLNAEPGKYVVVAGVTPMCAGDQNMRTFFQYVFFDKDTILATEVTVEPGRIAFIGQVAAKTKWTMKEADDAQSHYVNLLPTAFVTAKVSTPRLGVLVKIEKDPATEKEFWERAIKKVFNHEPDWLDVVKKQLSAMP